LPNRSRRQKRRGGKEILQLPKQRALWALNDGSSQEGLGSDGIGWGRRLPGGQEGREGEGRVAEWSETQWFQAEARKDDERRHSLGRVMRVWEGQGRRMREQGRRMRGDNLRGTWASARSLDATACCAALVSGSGRALKSHLAARREFPGRRESARSRTQLWVPTGSVLSSSDTTCRGQTARHHHGARGEANALVPKLKKQTEKCESRRKPSV
jgi:hypothetical protein